MVSKKAAGMAFKRLMGHVRSVGPPGGEKKGAVKNLEWVRAKLPQGKDTT